jgi:ATP-dependent exoDNAse (exonuclease V) beta subunit
VECHDETDGAFASIEALEGFADRCQRAEGASLRSQLLSLKINTQKGNQKAWSSKESLKQVKDDLKRLRDEKEAFEQAVQEAVALTLRNRLTEFLAFFQDRQREDALVDFQGLLLEARNVLAGEKPVRRYFQERFDALLIDEFQDTDPLQVEIAFFLAEDQAAAPADDWAHVRLKPGKLFLVGDPKQSIYRFRRADLGVYEKAKARVRDSGGDVLPLTANFRTVPSIIAFVNERFAEVFTTDSAHDPEPIPLKAERTEIAKDGARVVALAVPAGLLPEKPSVDVLREHVGVAIAGFVDEVTRARPWSVRDGDGVRPARPGDIGLLVRNLTGIEHLEHALRARGIGYRLVGGKAYHQRGEVAALRAVLLAIDNAADRLALVEALRSPFFGISDDDLARFVAKGGFLTYNAPTPEALVSEPVAVAFEVLKSLHRKRRIDPPSAVVRSLFERTRAMPGFLLSRDGDQAVANLWKIAEIAQAYEAAGPATLRSFVRFLSEQARQAREEGDSPVGDEAGQNVEILSVHRAKGLEYPIVVLADILSTTSSRDKAYVDHGAGEGWLKIGKLEPPGFGTQKAIEKAKAEAEERRLLYVALTRARDPLVLPHLPAGLERQSWATPALKAMGQSSHVTQMDARQYFPPPDGDPGPRPADALEGGEAELRAARAAQLVWDGARKARLQKARAHQVVSATVTGTVLGDEATRASTDPGAVAFGKLVHALLARTPLDGSGLEALAVALAPDFGVDRDGAASAASLVSATLTQPLFDRVRRAERVLRETPIAAALDGQRISGVIDLAFLEGGRWTVVEYKTGEAGDGHAAQEQVRLYGRALQATTTTPVVVETCTLDGVSNGPNAARR